MSKSVSAISIKGADGDVTIPIHGKDTAVGETSSLSTSAKTTLVDAVNEVKEDVTSLQSDILAMLALKSEKITQINDTVLSDYQYNNPSEDFRGVLYAPNLETIKYMSIANNAGVKYAVLPKLKTIGVGGFWGNHLLEMIFIPNSCRSINNQAFNYCGKLKYIIIDNDIGNFPTHPFYTLECKAEVIYMRNADGTTKDKADIANLINEVTEVIDVELNDKVELGRNAVRCTATSAITFSKSFSVGDVGRGMWEMALAVPIIKLYSPYYGTTQLPPHSRTYFTSYTNMGDYTSAGAKCYVKYTYDSSEGGYVVTTVIKSNQSIEDDYIIYNTQSKSIAEVYLHVATVTIDKSAPIVGEARILDLPDIISTKDKVSKVADIVIAAHDASDEWKAIADYVCDGYEDQVEIREAINNADAFLSLQSSPPNGVKILLSTGTFYIGGSIWLGQYSGGYSGVTFEGMGSSATKICTAKSTSSMFSFTAIGSMGLLQIKNLTIANNNNYCGTIFGPYDAKGIELENVTITSRYIVPATLGYSALNSYYSNNPGQLVGLNSDEDPLRITNCRLITDTQVNWSFNNTIIDSLYTHCSANLTINNSCIVNVYNTRASNGPNKYVNTYILVNGSNNKIYKNPYTSVTVNTSVTSSVSVV